VLLTIVTQVGGLFYLTGVLLYKLLKIKKKRSKILIVTIIYLSGSFSIVPFLAKQNNRVPMPVFSKKTTHIAPHRLFTVIAHRHYVKPEMKAMLLDVSEEMSAEFPGITIRYLDANFPLFKEFRMQPHLRHHNGKKLDVAFIWKKNNGRYTNVYWSILGYGFSAKPNSNETSYPEICAEQGKWQYNIMEKLVPDQHWRKLEFAIPENRALVKKIARHRSTRKIFIEPHLKERLGLSAHDNIRFHGCWAVRHDDHLHIDL